MKKILCLLSAMGVVLCSCNETAIVPDVDNEENVHAIVYARTEENSTKTSLDGDDTSGYEVLWSEGDEIAFDNGNVVYVLEEGENTTEATFAAKTTPATFSAGGTYEAIYPAAFAQSKSWPAVQTWSKTVAHIPMTAVGTTVGSDAPTLAFKNLGGLLRVRINAADPLVITKIEISSDDPLAGPVLNAEYSFTSPADGNLITVLDKDGSTVKTVTLDCGDGAEIAAGESEDFWFALPASVVAETGTDGTLTSVTQCGYHNFKVTVYDASGKVCTKTLKSADGLVIERSKVTRASFTVSNSSFDDAAGDWLCFTSTSDLDVKIKLNLNGTVSEPRNFEYSTDGQNWNPVFLNKTEVILSSPGEKAYFRTSDESVAKSFSIDYNNRYYFSCPFSSSSQAGVTKYNTYKISGNIMSLLDKTCRATDLAGDFCFAYLFSSCGYLESASDLILPATKLTKNCYEAMFSRCSGLEEGPALPATELAESCYSSMFLLCSSLKTAPDLPATTLTDNCYDSMFRGTAIKKTPLMKAGTMGKESCMQMFYECKQLAEAYDLEAAVLAEKCYYYMFYKCANLKSAPAIKAEKLAENCCYNMFGYCSSLVDVPALPDASLAPYCYNNMFNNCTSLVNVPALPATVLAEGCYRYMFSKCISMGEAPALPATKLEPYCYQGLFWYCESITECPELKAEEMEEGCYMDMFLGCSSLIEPAELPSVKLAPYCYEQMFSECRNLNKVPELPATVLAEECYAWMFLYCDNLENAPDSLPATTLAKNCYLGMFEICPKLKNAPALPATELADYCYDNMFDGCKSLESAPVLPATKLAPGCYYGMFCNCSKLTDAPALPSTELAASCYKYMFEGCSGIDDVVELPARNLAKDCYAGMFNKCSELSGLKVGFSSWTLDDGNSPTKNWLNKVAGTGTFICPSSLDLNFGADFIPEGWTVKTVTE